jgi:hypothetical protein
VRTGLIESFREVLGFYSYRCPSAIRQVHSRYFDAPFQIALVIRPESERPARAGFFFREPSGEMRTECSYEEFMIEAPAPAAPKAKEALVSKPAQSHTRMSAPAKPQQPQREALCPTCGSKHLRRSHRIAPRSISPA